MGRPKKTDPFIRTVETDTEEPLALNETVSPPVKIRKPRKKREVIEDPVTSTEIRSGEVPQKCAVDKKNLPPTTAKLPRLTITTYDEQGRMISTTFVCDPSSLQIARNEQQVFSAGGKPQKHIFLSIETNVVEIE
jgi:hypothetical protein